MYRGSTTLAHNIDEITKAVCDVNVRMILEERIAEDNLIEGNRPC